MQEAASLDPDVRLLGAMELGDVGTDVDIGPRQRRTVFAALVVDVGQAVSIDVLIDRVWGPAPPAGARAAVHAHIARLRTALKGARSIGPIHVRTLSGGLYALDLDPQRVDLHRFDALLGRAVRCDPEQRLDLLRQAMALWRGEPLAGLAGIWVEDVRSEWVRRRLTAAVLWAHEELDHGPSPDVVPRLAVLVREHPLDEPLAGVFIEALRRAGRGAEALAAYGALRQRLVDDLGTEPGPQLQALHRTLLRIEDDAMAATAVRPSQVPRVVHAFVGRRAELSFLERQLPRAAIVVLSGTAGVGKTELAIRAAHEAQAKYPDGQLFADMAGFSAEAPLTPGDALMTLLRALGVEQNDIPIDDRGRTSLYRSLLSSRRVLLILDNASDVEQVRPLLPRSPGSTVLITSRNALSGLVARDGAIRLEVEVLPPADAVTLLATLAGHVVGADEPSAGRVVAHCAHLPLAVRITAELAVTRNIRSLAQLADEIGAAGERLDLLDAGGDEDVAVRSVFRQSYLHLSAPAARMFRMLSLVPGGEAGVDATAFLVDAQRPVAQRLLDELVRAYLVRVTATGRYEMHDLLHLYAGELCRSTDPPRVRHEAVGRVLDFYLSGATQAAGILFPTGPNPGPARGLPEPEPVLELATHQTDAAMKWLDAHRELLVAAVDHAFAAGMHRHAVALATALFRYLDLGGHHHTALKVHARARQAARADGDGRAEATALLHQGGAHYRLGNLTEATSDMSAALADFEQFGDHTGQARALGNLCLILTTRGEFAAATVRAHQALKLYRSTDDRAGQARVLNNLGVLHRMLDQYTEANSFQHDSLRLYREIGDREGEALVLNELGNVHRLEGSYREASALHRAALDILIDIEDHHGELEVLNDLGETLTADGNLGEAVSVHTHALDRAEKLGVPYEQARGHNGLANAATKCGDSQSATTHWRAALAIFRRLGAPEAQKVDAALAAG